MLNCHDATRLMSDSQERTLAVRERLRLRLHVMMCRACRNFGRQMQILRSAARAFAKEASPPDRQR